ncbi:PAS domain S-box protein [Haloplanus salilacus]|uniref:PAS domain S-box protein n=1 Tax=Haloplanus salilacus TaxID=2949994 RepID=UPI0030CAB7DC
MTDAPTPEPTARIQLLVSESGDRDALEELLSERYEIVTDETLQPVDCYLIGDRLVSAYRSELERRKADTQPVFCPVLVIQRETAPAPVDRLARDDAEAPSLVDDVVSAPVGRQVLFRRVDNLLTRRNQSLALARRYERMESRFQQLFESTNDALFVVDVAEDTFVECNPAAGDLLGYARDELLGLRASETIHRSDRDTYRSFLQRVTETGTGRTDELRCETNAGDVRHLEVSGATLEESGDDRSTVILSARDVTERVNYQEELEWKTHAIETTPIGVVITDPHRDDNPIIYANEGFTQVTGYSEREVVGRNLRFLHGEETRPEPVAAMREAIDAHEQVTVELRNYRKDGTPFWNRVTIAPVTNGGGEVTHFVSFQEDITERKEYEEELELFRNAVEQAGHGVVITDRNGTIEYTNPRYAQDTGYAREELVGLNPAIVQSGKHDETFYEELWETILSGEVWEADIINQRKSGELYEVDQTIAPISDETGEITHFVGIQSDVSEQRLRNQQLEVFNRVLRHNIRNTMNVVTGNVSILEARIDDERTRTQLQTIEQQAASLIELSEKVRTVHDLVEGAGEPDDVRNISELLSELASNFEETYPTAEITVSAPDDIWVQSDGRLAEAVRETVTNAVVHNDRSEPTVDVTAEIAERDDAGKMVDIEILDDGPGIPIEEQAIISSGEETPLNHGSGIGLPLVYWITRSLGGEMILGENDPRGSRTTLRIPVESAPGPVEPPEN